MVEQDLPHQSFNLIALVISFLAFVWGWSAFRRFYSVLGYRYAVLTQNTVMLRGLGGSLSQFAGTMPSHTRSILHTRNSTEAKDVKFMYVPFHVGPLKHSQHSENKIAHPEHISINVKESQGAIAHESSDRLSIPVIGTAKDSANNKKTVTFSEEKAGPYSHGYLNQTFAPHPVNAHEIIPKSQANLYGYIPVWCATDCTILILYGLNMDKVKRFFRYSIKANKLFTKGSKYREKIIGITNGNKKSKGKKYNQLDREGVERHLYAERLTSLFIKKDLCTAYASMDSNNEKRSGLSPSSEHMYQVPIYDTIVSTGGTSNALSLSMDHGNDETADLSAEGSNGYAKLSNSTASSTKASSRAERNLSRFDLLRENSRSRDEKYRETGKSAGVSKTKKVVIAPTPCIRQSVGILIIPRDLPYTGTPESISSGPSTSTQNSSQARSRESAQGHSSDLEGDIELGFSSSGAGSFFGSKRRSTVGDSKNSVDQGRFTSLDFGLQVLSPSAVSETSGENVPAYEMEELYVHAAGSMFTASDIYGLASEGGNNGQGSAIGGEESNECVICLTEAQEIFLLPCRHLCVCKECFPHIDKCPVCRAPFDDYVTLRHDRMISFKAPKYKHNEKLEGNVKADDEKEDRPDGKMKTL